MMFCGECNVLTFTFQNLPLIAHEANFDSLLHAEIVPIDNVQYKKKRLINLFKTQNNLNKFINCACLDTNCNKIYFKHIPMIYQYLSNRF